MLRHSQILPKVFDPSGTPFAGTGQSRTILRTVGTTCQIQVGANTKPLVKTARCQLTLSGVSINDLPDGLLAMTL